MISKKSFKFKSLLVMLSLLFAVSCFATISNSVMVKADEGVWANYDLVYDADGTTVKGVNVKDSMGGILMSYIEKGAPTYPASGDTYHGAYALISYELEPITVGDYSMLLIQINNGPNQNASVRFFVETDDGNFYRFNTGSARKDTFINKDGSVGTLENNKSTYYKITKGQVGTLCVPMTLPIATGSIMPGSVGPIADASSKMPTTAKIVRFHVGVDTRSNGWYGNDYGPRDLGIGSIAALKASDNTVTKFFDASSLTYTANASETADVNLGDMAKGTKVYAKHSIGSGASFNVLDENGNPVLDDAGNNVKFADYLIDEYPAKLADITGVLTHKRAGCQITCEYVDENGNSIANATTLNGVFNASTASFDYEISAPEIAGYTFKEANKPLSGSVAGECTITLIYEVLELNVTVKYVDEDGNTIKEDEEVGVIFNAENGTFSYSIAVPSIWGYVYKESDLSLEGTITENIVITLTYKVDEEAYDNFDAIFSDGEFVGVNIKDSMSGSISMNIFGQTSNNTGTVYGYSVITIDIGNVDPSQSTGILIKTKRIDTANTMAQVRMFLEDSNGNLYRLFSRTNDVTGEKTTSVLIKPDGEISTVENDTANHRHVFKGSTNGTIYIPWTDIASIANEVLPEGVVFTKFHFGREGRYGSALNRPVALSHIAVVRVDGNNVGVQMLADLTKMSYTTDATAVADVNLANMTKGTKVYFNYITGVNVLGTDADIKAEQLSIVEFGRLPATITLKFVNEEGQSVKSDAIADATYQNGVSVYEIDPISIAGWQFVSADKELSGTTENDFTIVLTYKPIDYVITLEFVDENGVAIKESRTLSGGFSEYVEVEADEIEGYTFKESTSPLKFTIMNNKTIRLTYVKNAPETKSCNSSIGLASSGILALAVLSVAELLRRKSNKK